MQHTGTAGSYDLNSDYRYGFNGKEKDDEIKGEANSLDFGARIYDPRVGRWMSTDPKESEYAWQTTYSYHKNSPISLIDWCGDGDPPYIKNNVYFVHLFSPTVTAIQRSDGGTFTEAAISINTDEKTEYTINMQQFELLNLPSKVRYFFTLNVSMDGLLTQGLTVQNGHTLEGGRYADNYYIAQNQKGDWSIGLGNPPADSKIGFGGGIPVIVDAMRYGERRKYDEEGFEIQGSSDGYKFHNKLTVGKTILAFNDQNDFMIVSQQDGVNGMTLDQIREELVAKGYTNAISFDGGTSSTLVKDNQIIVSPDRRKNNSIPAGATLKE